MSVPKLASHLSRHLIAWINNISYTKPAHVSQWLKCQYSEYMSGSNAVAIHASSTENPNCRVAALLLAVLGLNSSFSITV